MRRFIRGISFILAVSGALVSGTLAFAAETKESQLFGLYAVIQELRDHYGMKEHKEENFGVTLDGLKAKYEGLIQNAQTLEEANGLAPKTDRPILSHEEYQQLLIGLAAELRDGHSNVMRNTKDYWTVGLKTAELQGHLYIVNIDKNYFRPSQSSALLDTGDEIIEVDGKPVAELAAQNMLYMQSATYAARYREAMETILNVPHALLRSKKTGSDVMIKVKRKTPDGERIITGWYNWINAKDRRALEAKMQYLDRTRPPGAGESEYTYGDYDTTESYFSQGLKNSRLGQYGQLIDIGKLLNLEIVEAKVKAHKKLARDFLDAKATTFQMSKAEKAQLVADKKDFNQTSLSDMEPVSRLSAYMVRFHDKNIGVLRIPSYVPNSQEADGQDEYHWMASIIQRFEKMTDVLIIDQLSNGGGSVQSVVNTLKLFAGDQGLETMTVNMKLSETLVQTFDPLGQASGDKASIQGSSPVLGEGPNFASLFMDEYEGKLLRDKLESGQEMSGPLPFMGTTRELREGSPGHISGAMNPVYTKPILVLNDKRSASGGDFMPAILQYNKRAVVMGETSMGLVGVVYRGTDVLPGSQMSARCTMGICRLPNGVALENVGTVPDIHRPITIRDVEGGFQDYAQDGLVAAVVLALGGGVDDISKNLTKLHSEDPEVLLLQTPPSKELTAMVDGVRRFTKKAVVDGEARDEEAIAAMLTVQYKNLFKTIGANSENLSDLEWKKFSFPLTLTLLSKDLILATQTSRDGYLARLKEMRGLPRYQSSKHTLALMDVLIEGLARLGADTNFHPSCANLLAPSS